MAADELLSDDTISYEEASLLRTRKGHDATIHHYRQLLLRKPQDTSAATRLAASKHSPGYLARVGWPYSQVSDRPTRVDQRGANQEDWEGDIEKLRALLRASNYRHSSLRKCVFNLPIGINDDDGDDGGNHCDHRRQSLERYKNDYPMGPTYVRPLVPGQGLDLSSLIDAADGTATLTSGASPIYSKNDDSKWQLPSLQCLATLFLLSSCVPKRLFLESVIGGDDALELLLRLGVVFVFGANLESDEQTGNEDEWIVPLVHLFPLDIPPIRSLSSGSKHPASIDEGGKNMVLMTDLHPTVLGMTSIPKAKVVRDDQDTFHYDDEDKGSESEGAVMYIGPDSLALVHHLHASMSQYLEAKTEDQTFCRVLDVCTGSGVQALASLAMLSDKAGMDPAAIAVDINERALRFTRFNARLNGYSDSISTVRADLLSGKSYQYVESTRVDASPLARLLLDKLRPGDFKLQSCEGEQRFDIILANPPFIPVPPSRSDNAASSLRENDKYVNHTSTPRYGLFSSGGPSGEECLRAIVKMAPLLLRSDAGLFVVVSEFMNPPSSIPLSSVSQETVRDDESEDDGLTSKMERWWDSQCLATDSSDADGILFTNELAIDTNTYAQRRAMKHDEEDINVW
eukprot:CAMPEP_0181083204 /NCGR_PEP_ID=MMETSP1071-20121207/4036_1 /TAXON_ID=35127 /ORGANISM="Thalassiosira sp., Strain NH16" /LENGTH=627 /DNA_ID=CAMNT_0023164853 /DNA_START=294 /DNA_END=2174 /DNA_ORIENTATION=+